MDAGYEYMRDLAEAELERRIDKHNYYQDLLALDAQFQEWLEAIQAENLKYQQENEDASINPR